MFERFSEQARQAVVLAQQQARELRHNYIGTEHLLIAVLRDEAGTAPAVLATVDLTAEEARTMVIAIVGRGEADSHGMVPFTPRAKRILELGFREAVRLGRREVGPEHLLLALMAEGEGLAARILSDSGADANAIRATLIGMYGDWPELPPADVPSPVEEIPEVEIDLGWRGRPIALAALGAAVLARAAFRPGRSGGLEPLEMEVLVFLALAARAGVSVSDGEELESVSVALATYPGGVDGAVYSLRRQGLVAVPDDFDGERVMITPAGTARVEEWLRATIPLFGGWPPTIPDVDDDAG